MFKKRKQFKEDVQIFKSLIYCPDCFEKKKHITVFCLEDKDTYDITVCLNCCKDPLTRLRLAEKPPYDKSRFKYMNDVFEIYSKGIMAELNEKSKLFEALRNTQESVGENVSFMKTGIVKKK